MRATLTRSLFVFALCALASPVLAADAPAPAPLPVRSSGIVGVGVTTSTVFQEGQSSFSGIAARLRIRAAAFRPNLEILPTMEYWQNNSHLDTYDIRTSRRDATLGTDVRWVFDTKKGWQPYAGAGVALHFLNEELKFPPHPAQSSGLVRGGFAALGGVEFNMGARLGSFVELKYHAVSKYRQIKFNTGLAWNF